MGFTAMHEVVERSSGAFGEDFHRAVVDHEEVVSWLWEGGQQRPQRSFGGGRSSRRGVYAKLNHMGSRRALYRAVFFILTLPCFAGLCPSSFTCPLTCSY